VKYGRELLREVAPYVPGEQPKQADVIKLNTNENPYPPAPGVLTALKQGPAEMLRKYPDPVSQALREACAKQYGYDGADWVIAGNGMDELLALAIRTFTDPGDTVLTTYPTYVLYETLAELHGAKVTMVDLDHDFQLPETFYTTPARIVFLPRPNSPSGVSVPREVVDRLCKAFDGIVVIDEAYVDFADDTCMDFPKRFPNAIVMRTFSKSFSLAGIRLGIAVAQPDIITEFLKTKDSYNLNALTQATGLAAIQDYAHMESGADTVRATRTRLTAALRDLGFTVPDSQSNFVLARWTGTPNAPEIFAALRERNILVRYFNARRLDQALRITVGTDSEIDALLGALQDILTA
jgi:histidinol-phosphate aminotransferase